MKINKSYYDSIADKLPLKNVKFIQNINMAEELMRLSKSKPNTNSDNIIDSLKLTIKKEHHGKVHS